MAGLITQAQRLIAVDTPLGTDQLLLRSFSGAEGISKLFHFQLDMLSEDFDISFDDIVGQQVTISVKLADGLSERYVNGHVSRFSQLPGEDRLARYQADVVPWMWFLTRTADCRIFQNKNVPDIVQQVFRDFGFQDFEDRLQGSYDPWEYCVQYRETACNFVLRLLEQEGIFFFFRHEKDKHVLVLADSPSAHQPCPMAAKVRYEHVVGSGYAREDDVVLHWRYQQEFRPGKYALNDYNFETPGTSLLSNIGSTINQGGNQNYEVFDYPGEYEKKNQGDVQSKLRIQEQELPHEVVRGGGNCRTFSSGFRFELTGHERKDQNTQYVLTEVTHSAHSGDFHSRKPGEGAAYSNSFTCTPLSVPFRPPRVTAKHLVQGPQTAVVVGPAGEEIYTDKHGRVKVQFHWDRVGKHDEKSSCWMRVSQPWAGKNWGQMWIPRIGQEVIVDFLEGDPDRPLITGRVYNGEEKPPYELPKYQTVSTMKSHSSKGGGGFNELRFEDNKGKEQVFIHSQKRMDVRVLGSMYETNHANRHMVVGAAQGTETGGSLAITVSGDNDNHVKGGRHTNVDGSETEVVAGDVVHDYHANYSCIVGSKVQINAQEIVIEGSSKIGLTVGANSVTIDQAGVTVVGMMVKINSGGAGPICSAPALEDALDAALSDNGEPGYLERVQAGGGGGGGRRRRTANVQHAISRPVTRLANGDLQVGDHMIIHGDQDFQEKALRDLSRMDTTAAGQDHMDAADRGGHDVTIQRGPVNQTTFNSPSDGAASGKPAYDGTTGTGAGTGSTISYDPDREPPTNADPSVRRPADVALNHEMGHSVHGSEGTYDGTPDAANPNNPSVEETQTIEEDNLYRDERGIPRRRDHTVL